MTAWPLRLSVEQQLLLACLKAAIDPEKYPLVGRWMTKRIDWIGFDALAERHRVTPIVWGVLKSDLSAAGVPHAYLSSAEVRARQNAMRNLQSASTLIGLTNHLRRQGIRVMVLKGVGLAMQTYARWEKRHAGDIDLFVHQQDLIKAASLLIAAGFRKIGPDFEPGSAKFGILDGTRCHMEFVDPDRRIRIELHWRLARDHGSFPLSFEAAWRQRCSVKLAGSSIQTLSLPHAMLFGCYHGAVHGWHRLFWLYDMALGINRFSDKDWHTWIPSVRRMGLERPVAAALELLRIFFEVPLPSRVRQMIDASGSLGKALRNAAKLMFAFDSGPYKFFSPPNFYRLQHDWIMRKGIKERMAFVGGKIAPSLGDVTAVPLPEAVAFLYYPLKPMIWLYRKTISAIQSIAHHTPASAGNRR
jgi:hypothetical protein